MTNGGQGRDSVGVPGPGPIGPDPTRPRPIASLSEGRGAGNRLLEDRSYLEFNFPQGGGRGPMRFVLPFYENIKISESQEAQYQKYDLLARSSSLYSYTGSPSRKIRLKFNLTVPHLISSAKDANPLKYIDGPAGKGESIKEKTAKFFEEQEINKAEGPHGSIPGGTTGLRNATIARKKYAKIFKDRLGEDFDVQPDELRNHYTATWDDEEKVYELESTQRGRQQNILNVLIWWINLIRASTKNNANDVILGPPIVRLSHGVLYNDIPCICTKYTIDPDSGAGYDKKTLLERILRVSMDLEEARVGDLVGEYKPGTITGDNNAGWEAIIEHNTSDPYISDTELLKV